MESPPPSGGAVAQPPQLPPPPPPPRRKAVTVEPLLLAYVFCLGVHSTAYQQLLYTGYCLQRGASAASSCDGNATAAAADSSAAAKELVDSLQASTSRMRFYCSAVTILPSVVVCAYLGAWSDRGGRKRPLLVPPLGAAASYAAWAVLARYVGSLDPAYALLCSAVLGLGGYFPAAVQVCFSYLVAVVRPETRTMRIAIVDGTFGLSIVAAAFAIGPLLLRLGLAWTYAALAAINVAAVLYCVLWIDEVPSGFKAAATAIDDGDGRDRCPSFVSPIADYLRCVFKKRAGRVTLCLHASLAAYFFAYSGGDGASDVLYLFLTKVHGFSTSLFGYYVGVGFGLKVTVGVAVLLFARRRLHADDLTVAMCGCLSAALSYCVVAASVAPWMIWLASCVGSLQLFYSIGVRSYVSSLVPDGELGKVFAFMSSGQSLLTFVDSLLFNNLYPVTLDFYPGLCFALASLLSLIALAALAFLKNHALRSAPAPHGRREPPVKRSLSTGDGDADVDDVSRLLPSDAINAD